MLSSRLIRMIGDHWEEITARVVRQIRIQAALRELGKLPEPELRERARELLLNLGHWLVCPEEELAGRYQRLGETRFEEGIPLHELVCALHLIKEQMIEYVREQGICQTSVDVYAEEELLYNVDRVFDKLVYHVVRGYERALRGHARAVAAAGAGR